MWLLVKTLFSSASTLKWVAIAAILFSLVAGASGLTYSKTKSYFVKQGKARVMEITVELDKVRMEYSEYVALQKDKVHALELESSKQARLAQDKISSYRNQLSKSKSDYEKLLAQRNEVPGYLSSSAVDTINAKTDLNNSTKPVIDGVPALP